MAAIGRILISPITGLVNALTKKPKAPKPAMALPQATPRANSEVTDALLQRRGSAANQRTGRGGAESSAAPKKMLMGQ